MAESETRKYGIICIIDIWVLYNCYEIYASFGIDF